MRKSLLAVAVTLLAAASTQSASATVLISSPSGAEGYAGGAHALLVDLSSTSPITIQSITTLISNGTQIEFYTRDGTAINGVAGKSSAGWTSIGVVTGTTVSGNLTAFDVPDFNVVPGGIVGLAMRQVEFNSSLGFRFLPGPVSTPLHLATDGTLKVQSGHLAFNPFTSASNFSVRNFNGSVTYTAVIPEPSTLAAVACAGLTLVRRRRD